MSLDYIFGRNTSSVLDDLELEFQYSRRTGRLRYVLSKPNKELLFTFRPNGSIAPSIQGFKILLSKYDVSRAKERPWWVIVVLDGVTDVVARGKTVFCKHVVDCSDLLRAGQDVVVVNEKCQIVAVGRSILAGSTIKQFKRGAAVKVREGANRAPNEP
jgi:uncharacterized protein with predicted RNA binding PUA domain